MRVDSGPTDRRTGVVSVVAAVAIALVVGVLGSGSVDSAPAGADPSVVASEWDQPCLDNVGITVVIDFQELAEPGQNPRYVRCAAGKVDSGFDALDKAGISHQTAYYSAGFLCKIAGKPENDRCINTSPADAYWSYWIAPRGGQWCYTNLGAGNRTGPLPPGSIEGWSFSKDKQSTTNSPPRYRPPDPIPGQAPNQIPASDCNGTVPLAPDSSITTTTTSGGTAQTQPGGSGGVSSNGGTSNGGAAGSGGVGQASGGVHPDPNHPGEESADSSTTTVPDEEPADEQDAAEVVNAEVAVGRERTAPDGSTEALEQIDLSSDGSSGGSPIALVMVGVAVIGLGVGGVVITRRRRALGAP